VSYDENALRKPGFIEGTRIVLGDGQAWSFPPVKIRIYPDVADDGSLTARFKPTYYADGMEKEVDALFGVGSPDAVEYLTAQFSVAVKLLKSNYDLPNAAFSELLGWVRDDPTSEKMWDKVRAIVMGRYANEEAEDDFDPKELS